MDTDWPMRSETPGEQLRLRWRARGKSGEGAAMAIVSWGHHVLILLLVPVHRGCPGQQSHSTLSKAD